MTMLAIPDLCPCCLRPVAQRPATERPRRLTDAMVAWLADLHARASYAVGPAGDPTAVDIRSAHITSAGGDYAKTTMWGLATRGERAGRWRITPHGVDFLLGRVDVPLSFRPAPDGSLVPSEQRVPVTSYRVAVGAWERDNHGAWKFRRTEAL